MPTSRLYLKCLFQKVATVSAQSSFHQKLFLDLESRKKKNPFKVWFEKIKIGDVSDQLFLQTLHLKRRRRVGRPSCPFCWYDQNWIILMMLWNNSLIKLTQFLHTTYDIYVLQVHITCMMHDDKHWCSNVRLTGKMRFYHLGADFLSSGWLKVGYSMFHFLINISNQ